MPKELSIFVDESGDFGESKKGLYLVTLLFHNQEMSINQLVQQLEFDIQISGYEIEYIHTGPLIRREEVFSNFSVPERRKLLYKLRNFYRKCPIQHSTVVISRKEAPDKISLAGKIAKLIKKLIQSNQTYFDNFEKIVVYYDNGQTELNAILNAVFSMEFSKVKFRRAEPQKYRLLQVADFICTFELIRIKKEENRLSKSERMFFSAPQELKKNFLNEIKRKRLDNQ